MEKLLARLERRFDRIAIPNLISIIVAGTGLVWILSRLRPGFEARLFLSPYLVMHGEVWRLVTFLFIPSTESPFWVLINLYFTWWVGTALERHWGKFKFNAYYGLGALLTIAAAFLCGPETNLWLNSSLFLAYATLFPEERVMLIVIPMAAKWLGLLAAVGILVAAVQNGLPTRAAILASLLNYIVFFGQHWMGFLQGRRTLAVQKSRLEAFRSGQGIGPSPSRRPPAPGGEVASAAPAFGQRTCAICGAREADGTDIRVCSCEKCGGAPRTLCLEHARNH
jgi:membrane associated rhomboid family serine protease